MIKFNNANCLLGFHCQREGQSWPVREPPAAEDFGPAGRPFNLPSPSLLCTHVCCHSAVTVTLLSGTYVQKVPGPLLTLSIAKRKGAGFGLHTNKSREAWASHLCGTSLPSPAYWGTLLSAGKAARVRNQLHSSHLSPTTPLILPLGELSCPPGGCWSSPKDVGPSSRACKANRECSLWSMDSSTLSAFDGSWSPPDMCVRVCVWHLVIPADLLPVSQIHATDMYQEAKPHPLSTAKPRHNNTFLSRVLWPCSRGSGALLPPHPGESPARIISGCG